MRPLDDPGPAFAPRGPGFLIDAAAADERSSILIVDDLPEKLLVFGTVLEELDQDLVFVRSGADALREVLQREFAVILLDVNMPDIDGFETATLVRRYKKSAHTPIIFITSYADELQTVRGYSLGAVDFILSPVVPEVLRSKVRVFVELHMMRRRATRQAEERTARMAADAARVVAERNDRRSHFIANASWALGASLDLAVGEQRLVELLLGANATRVLLVRIDDAEGAAESITRGVLGATTPDATVRLRSLDADTLGPVLQAAVMRAHRLGKATALDAAGLAALGALGGGEGPSPHAAVAVPVATARRRMGVLVVAEDRHEPDEESGDWSVPEELAARAAIAFDNAELFASLKTENAERVAAEAKLQEVNRRKDEFLAMLAHELRNPLAPIRNALELMRRIAPPDPKLDWAGAVMDRQLRHMARLIGELLDVARISEGKIALTRSPLDLRTVVEASVETTQPFIDQHRHRLQLNLPDTPVWMQGDFTRLSQVLGNLLHNAAKYSADGSLIVLELEAGCGEATLRVRDNGIGIDAALLPSIFEPFTQGVRSLDRSQGGLGIGLTLVRRLVELHGGRVEAHSAGLEQGAEFRVFLPAVSVVKNGEPDVPVPEPAPPDRSTRGQRVLIVDDNRDAADSIAQYLQLEGHEVRSVGDGQQALVTARVLAPQVVVLDIGLPGLSGYEVARRIRQMPEMRSALLVALTGYGQREDRQQAEQAGFDHHFVKPTDPRALAELIARTSERRAAEDSLSPPERGTAP